MSLGRPKATLEVTTEEQQELTGFAASRTIPHALVSRARLVLWSAEGRSNSEIAAQLQWSKATVGKWRQRLVERRIQGLYDELRPGRPPSLSDEKVASLLRRTLKTKPPAGTHWSVRQAAEANRISKSTVSRVFQTFAVQPHRSKTFKLSTDPFFVEKVRDIVGLYLNPPDHAIVLAVDEKSQIQALSRTQSVLPMGLGYVEGVTHDYVRHGTTTLFAALDVATGTVFTECKPRHRHQEFLGFLAHRPGGPRRSRRASDRRQLRHPQACQGGSVAGAAAPLSHPLHAYLCLLAEPGGALVWVDHATGDSPWQFPQRPRSHHSHPALRRALQSPLPPLYLDRHRRFYLPETC
jgi:transposase